MSLLRRLVIFAVACIAFASSSVALLISIQDSDYHLRGYVDPTQSTALPFRPENRLGINADLFQYGDVELTEQLDLMQQANIAWVRQIFNWADISTDEDTIDWSEWDRIINTVHSQSDLELVVVFVGMPDWALQHTSSTPFDVNDFADFLAEFAQRYNVQVNYYQIWDDPNTRIGWVSNDLNPVHYAEMLQMAYTAIHDYDRDAVVISAGLAPIAQPDAQSIGDLIYLRELYDLGIKDFSDAVAVKPYGFQYAPDDRSISANRLNFSRMIAFRELMVEHDDATTPLWASNWGWGNVDNVTRINYTLAALDRVEREWPWAGPMILDYWQPDPASEGLPDDFSLHDLSGNPSELLQALSSRYLPEAATNGLYAASNVYSDYSGIWTFSELGADAGWVNDSRVTFSFSGADVAVYARQNDYTAYIYPSLDGASANALPQDTNGNPYLALKSGDLSSQNMVVSVAHGLDDRTHQLELVIDELIPGELNNRWPLIGFAVSDGNLAASYNRQVNMAWLTAIITFIVMCYLGALVKWQFVFADVVQIRHIFRLFYHLVMGGLTSVALLIGMILTFQPQFAIPIRLRSKTIQILITLLISSMIYLNEISIIITLVASFILFALIFNWLELGVMLTLFWSPFFLYPVDVFQFAFPMSEIIILITTGAWILRLFAARDPVWQHIHPDVGKFPSRIAMDYVVGAWVFVGLASLSWSAQTGLALTELRTLFVEPTLLYFIIRTINPDKNMVIRLVGSLIAAGLAVAIIGLMMWLLGQGIIEAEASTPRLTSVYGSPNNVGLLLGRCIPFLLAIVLIDRNSSRQYVMLLMLGILGIALLLTQSAGALFVGVPAAIVAVVGLTLRQRALLPLITLAIIFFIGLFAASQVPRFERMTDLSQGTNFYRLRIWDSAINAIEDQPFRGLGPDQFLYAFRDVYMLPDAWEEPDLSHPHNILLDQWTRLGIVGVVILLVMQVIFWRRVIYLYKYIMTHEHNLLVFAIIIGTAGSMVNLLAHGLVDNSIYVIDLAYIYLFLLSLPFVINETNNRPIDASRETMV